MIEDSGKGLRVSGPMVIANASELLAGGRLVLAASAKGLPFTIDLAAVEETDSSALSVLFGWLRSARAADVDVRIVNPPASMLSLAGLYGVSDSLPLA